MSRPPDAEALQQLAQKGFPHCQLLDAWPLPGGISNSMIAVTVQVPDGETVRMVVRSPKHPSAAEDEYRLLQITYALGLKTPKPYWLDLTTKVWPQPCLALEYLAGEMTFTPNNLDNYLSQLATQLAHIHSLDLSQHDLSFLPQNEGVCAELRRERPLPNSAFPQETKIRMMLATADPPESTNKTALLHGDFWPGNSLWQDEQLTAVIDWEDALLGDSLIDLAQSRSELVWIFGQEALEGFTRYYQQQTVLDYTTLPYWDLCAALRQIRLLGDDLPGFADYFAGYGRNDITPQTIRHNLNAFIAQAIKNAH